MKTLIYQLYPSSWGSFTRMTEFLPRIAALSVDYIWLSPFYPSPWVDGGYDVANYTDVDPRFGTLADFDKFVEEAGKLGMKVIIDLVLNHTSTEHEWFKRSVAGDKDFRDFYHWEDRDLGWVNMFDGGSAFKYMNSRGQFYLHTFHGTQADLNWENSAVIWKMMNVIDFWTFKHGVAGFRLDVCQFLAKKMEPSFGLFSILKYWQQPGTLRILHQLFDHRDLFIVGEALTPTKKMFSRLAGPDGPLTAAFNVQVLDSYDRMLLFFPVPKSFGRFERTLKKFESVPGMALTLESHDEPRYTSRTGKSGKELLNIMFSSRVQTICLYQGQELGLLNPELPDDIAEYTDIQTIMQYERAVARGKDGKEVLAKLKPLSRENARVPLDLAEYERQEQDRDSCLKFAQRAIERWKN